MIGDRGNSLGFPKQWANPPALVQEQVTLVRINLRLKQNSRGSTRVVRRRIHQPLTKNPADSTPAHPEFRNMPGRIKANAANPAAYGVARLLRYDEIMGNFESTSHEDPEALLDLLEDIVASYQDNDSRPVDALSLYRQRVQLGSNYRVKLAKRFVVIEGGGTNHKPVKSTALSSPPRLRLVPKITPPAPVG